jgi:hypothetical protein
MARNARTNLQSARRTLSRLALERKRTVVALGLSAIMAIMWVRVLLGQKPDSAAAGPEPVQQGAAQQERPALVRLIELPKVPGRNDCIHRDFFAAQNRAYFQPNGARRVSTDAEVQIVSSGHAREVIQRVAQRLKLEAVLWSEDPGKDPQVFINDRLLRTGEKLTVTDGTDSIEFEVLQIQESSVLIGSGGTRLTLKLAQYFDVNR